MERRTRLCNVRFTTVKARISLGEVKINTRNGDFHPASLAQAVNTFTFNELVVKSWLEKAGKPNLFQNRNFDLPGGNVRRPQVDAHILCKHRSRQKPRTDVPPVQCRCTLPALCGPTFRTQRTYPCFSKGRFPRPRQLWYESCECLSATPT